MYMASLAIAILLFDSTAMAAPIELLNGELVKNHDGDTLHVRDAERGIIIRLSGADAPETGQSYWREARNSLRNLAEGNKVTASCYKRDKYDREVCHVSTAGSDVGLSLIETGHAWYAFQYAAELSPEMRQRYQGAEDNARWQRLGLWQEPNPMPPWECRKLKKNRQNCR